MYLHINKEQRIELAVLRRMGFSLREIAERLGCHFSSLSRELKRNRCRRPGMVSSYYSGDANRAARHRRTLANERLRKIWPGSRLEALLEEKIAQAKWSPEQVSGWMKVNGSKSYVSHQTIYDWIYEHRFDLRQYLHCRKGRYRRTRANAIRQKAREKAAATRHISRRPKHVDKRKTLGHWEGDTVHGAGKSGYISTFVERKSGYLAAQILTVSDFGSIGFAKTAKTALKDLPARRRKTMTLDNGPEMKLAERMEKELNLSIYYATPYHSWERGTNENTNGLLRYFFPKKSSFKGLAQKELDLAVDLLNNRPRKRLNWRTPAQILKR